MKPRRQVKLNLTESGVDTLHETIEIALGQAHDTLELHQKEDGPVLGDDPERQVDQFVLQLDLVEGAQQRIEDLEDIQGQLEGGTNVG